MSTQIYDLIDLNQSKSGLCIRKNNHYTNRAFRAEDEVRTRDPQLGRLMLYQLSYFRKQIKVGEDGFEPPKVKTSRFTVCPIWPLWYLPNMSELRNTFQVLSRWRDSNPRPADYKSAALANWATSAELVSGCKSRNNFLIHQIFGNIFLFRD